MLYLPYDTETGGKNAKTTSLLTSYFAIVDENFNFQAELDLSMRPSGEDEPYHVTAGALKTNKINLIEHNKHAITVPEASVQLHDFLKKYKPSGYERLIPVGHNLGFDNEFVRENLITKDVWERYVSCFKIDTQDLAHFIWRVLNYPNPPRDFKLGTLADHLHIPRQTLHTARGDGILAMLVFRELKKILENRR